MCTLVGRGDAQGALGLSPSLQHVPCIFNSTGGARRDGKVAACYGGAYFTHQRSESDRIFASSRRCSARPGEGIRTQWHLNGLPAELRPHAEIPRRSSRAGRGIDVAANRTEPRLNGLDACLPFWVREGGREPLLKRSPILPRASAPGNTIARQAAWENQWLRGRRRRRDGGQVVPSEGVRGKTVAAIAAAFSKDPRTS